MSFVLYALGALLLAWSGLTILRGDGFGALDIAATLAGAGAISVGLGAVAAAIKDAGRMIRAGNEPPASGARVEPAPARAPALKPSAALPPAPTLDESPARSEEPKPEPVGPSRAEAAMAVKRGLRPVVQLNRPRSDPSPIFAAPEPALPRAPEPKPAKPAAERRRWPMVEPEPEPEIGRAEVQAPEPEPEPEPVPASGPPAPPQPEPVAEEPAPQPAPPGPVPAVQAPALARQKAADVPNSFGASTPEWLVRARARREARALAEAEGRSRPRQAPDEPAPPLHAVEPQAEAAPPRTILREGEHNGVTYRFLGDGSIEAESPHGQRRFSSIEELKQTVAAARARGELDQPRSDPESPNEGDALDAAIAALEEPPSGDGASRQG